MTSSLRVRPLLLFRNVSHLQAEAWSQAIPAPSPRYGIRGKHTRPYRPRHKCEPSGPLALDRVSGQADALMRLSEAGGVEETSRLRGFAVRGSTTMSAATPTALAIPATPLCRFVPSSRVAISPQPPALAAPRALLPLACQARGHRLRAKQQVRGPMSPDSGARDPITGPETGP